MNSRHRPASVTADSLVHSRRRFLRGVGGSVLALPWMESLAAAGAATPSMRMAHFYVPIGVVRRAFFPGEANDVIPKGNLGNVMKSLGKQDPTFRTAPLHDLPPTLRPLAEYRDHFTLVTGMDRQFQQGTDVHAQCASCYLSSAKVFEVKQSAWPLDRTLDHIVADHVGGNTPFRTLEFSCNSHRDNKESIYFDNISWYGTGHVAPSIRDPRQMYSRLFGSDRSRRHQAMTDLIRDDAHDMRRGLGMRDRHKLGEYLDSLRTIENQMLRLEQMRTDLAKVKMEQPPEAHLPRGEYIRLMADLMVVALQSGLTNVATFMVGPERWDTPFLYESLFDKPRSHHQMSHNQTEMIDDLIRVDHFHMQAFAHLVDKLATTTEADGSTLLDNTLLTYGSGLGDGSTHQYNALPIIVAGGGSKIRHGRHINLPEGTPLANLWLTQARLMGLSMDSFADSNGTVDALLSEPGP